MASLSVHNVDPEMARRIRERAREAGKSLSQTVKELLGAALGEPRSTQETFEDRFKRLEEFCGVWTEEEVREFEEAIADCERVEPEDWQ